jgi:hypothetical protein
MIVLNLLTLCSILLATGDTLAWRDLSIGSSVNIYKRVYYLHGCDVFTRNFMVGQGMPQAADGLPPQDPYHYDLQQQRQKKEEAKSQARVQSHERPVDSKYYLDNARKVQRYWFGLKMTSAQPSIVFVPIALRWRNGPRRH